MWKNEKKAGVVIKMDDKIVLKAENLEKTFGAGKKAVKAVDGVSFAVREKEIFALLGPNGAGKTTTVKMLLNLVSPDKGSIQIFGEDMPKVQKEVMKEIGTLLEGSRNLYWHMTVRENVYYFANLRGKSAREVKDDMEMWAERLRIQDKLEEEVGKLSRGMQQKAAIICVLATKPKLLILDELLLGLDIITRFEVEKLVKELKEISTLIISSHDLRFIEKVSDRILIINKGKVVAEGTASELRHKISYAKYRFTLRKNEESRYLEELKSIRGVEISFYEGNIDTDILELTFEKPELIYDVFDIFRKFSVIPVEIDNLGEPFEEIFKSFVEGGENK
jgi:ABC-2 type transport system ATP-binding protein